MPDVMLLSNNRDKPEELLAVDKACKITECICLRNEDGIRRDYKMGQRHLSFVDDDDHHHRG